MWRTVSGVIFIASLFAFDVNCLDFKQYSDAELTEVTFKDKYGNVKAKVVPRSADDSEGAGVDDEDSKSTDGSGDTDGVLDDQPMNVSNNINGTESTKAVISPSPSVFSPKNAAGKTTQISSTTKHVVKTQSLYSTVKSSTQSKIQLQKSSNQPIVIEPTSTLTNPQASGSVSVTRSPSLLTTEVTTKLKTTRQPSTTSDEIPTTRENVHKPTTESISVVINGTKDPVVVSKRAGKNGTFVATKVKTTPVVPTSKSTESSVNVKAHRDPKEKQKTLFGFVTVEILIALLAGALFSILLVAFLVYRLKKRNEGSYELSETIALRPKELDEMGTKKEVFV